MITQHQFNRSTALIRILSFACAVALPIAAIACSVPVFRYALEHWRPDAYRVFVYHEQDVRDSDQRLLQWAELQNQAGANLQIKMIDLRETLAPVDQERWERLGKPVLPRMVVQLPGGIGGGEAPVGSSAWEETELKSLVSSPVRIEIGERLVAGEVVWVFLESGKPADDDRLFELLSNQLAFQQGTLELPAIEEADLGDLSTDPENLEIRFSAIRLSRQDLQEKWLIEMLLSIEPDLRDEELVNQAMVFPIFGRGRALYALVGEGINADMIGQAAIFLTGACQCTVKADNPGVDLLLPLQWDNLIQVTEPVEVSLPLVGLGGALSMSDPGVHLSEESPLITGDEEIAVDSRQTEEKSSDETASTSGNTLAAGDGNAPAGLIWWPIVMMIILGTIVGLLGTSILRRQ